jgi:non-ribosomal peptide synthetase component E (peptide arylation enzyme)
MKRNHTTAHNAAPSLSPPKPQGMYFTGDGCRRDEDGYYWITGRVDDVMNVSGHRRGGRGVARRGVDGAPCWVPVTCVCVVCVCVLLCGCVRTCVFRRNRPRIAQH